MHDKGKEYFRLTPNQVVAHNLRLARLLRGWTQDEAAEHLEPYLGVRWSNASYSAAERSTDRPGRIRNFTADELIAFALAFKLPVTWFLLPPEKDPAGRVPVIATPGAPEGSGHLPGVILELVFGNPESQALTEKRVEELLDDLGLEARGLYMRLIDGVSGLAARVSLKHALGSDLRKDAATLRRVAQLMEAAEEVAEERLETALQRMVAGTTGTIPKKTRAMPKLGRDAGPH